MMKKILIILFFISTIGKISAESNFSLFNKNISYRDLDDFKYVSFHQDNTIDFFDDTNVLKNDFWNRSFNFQIEVKENLNYMIISCNEYKKRFLILYSSDLLIIYDESDRLIFNGTANINPERIYFPNNIIATSELKEGDIVYKGNNLANLTACNCWVEGVPGYGIGESVKFDVNASGIFVLNGYVSGKKPYLYSQNSRVKILELSFEKTNVKKIFELADTPNPQFLKFDASYSGKIRIEVKDIYCGSKYHDTCLNAILIMH